MKEILNGHINPKHLMRHPVAEGAFSLFSIAAIISLGASASKIENFYAQAAAVVHTVPVAFEAPKLEAASAIVYDIQTGKSIFEKNADEKLPLASLTKLMSAEVVLAEKSFDTAVVITPDDLAPEGDSGLRVGDTWSLKDLLTFGLIVSSNDAMAAAAASAGTSSIIERMNEQAQTLGLTNMSFKNPTGLDVTSEEAGAYGSAHDMALLTADFLSRYPELFAATVVPRTSLAVGGGLVSATPTASPILDIPGLIGAKTGYTDLAGGNLVVAFDLEVGHPVVIVVLGSSIDGRFSDVRALIEATREKLLRNN